MVSESWIIFANCHFNCHILPAWVVLLHDLYKKNWTSYSLGCTECWKAEAIDQKVSPSQSFLTWQNSEKVTFALSFLWLCDMLMWLLIAFTRHVFSSKCLFHCFCWVFFTHKCGSVFPPSLQSGHGASAGAFLSTRLDMPNITPRF